MSTSTPSSLGTELPHNCSCIRQEQPGLQHSRKGRAGDGDDVPVGRRPGHPGFQVPSEAAPSTRKLPLHKRGPERRASVEPYQLLGRRMNSRPSTAISGPVLFLSFPCTDFRRAVTDSTRTRTRSCTRRTRAALCNPSRPGPGAGPARPAFRAAGCFSSDCRFPLGLSVLTLYFSNSLWLPKLGI